MKIGFVVPVLADYDVSKCYKNIKSASAECKVDFEIIFAFSGKLTSLFSHVRSTFMDKKEVKAFKVDKAVNEHKLITLALESCEKYNATIVYSAKEEINKDVIKAFVSSWRTGNKIVYLKKIFYGPKKIFSAIKELFYRLGMKIINCFRDFYAETDIQLLDQEVVKTVNQLPSKNRMLRTMDGFIGYNYDIIHMEVDSKLRESKYYEEKTKMYKAYLAASVICGVLCIADFVMTIIAVSLGWKLGLVWTLMLILGIVLFAIAWLVFFTRRILARRVGPFQDEKELRELKTTIEKYNY